MAELGTELTFSGKNWRMFSTFTGDKSEKQ